jgi:UDPglucose--hexose-1-phosphate uridylyltransferase
VQVSPHRTRRPWRGEEEAPPAEALPAYDPACYLCPGNERAGGARNSLYTGTFVFTNDFSGVLPDVPPVGEPDHPLLRPGAIRGTSRVLCFSPRHDLTLPQMELAAVRAVVEMWADQTAELGRSYRWVQLFENKGTMMGASNPHPHGQLWAVDVLPNEAAAEDRQQRLYAVAHGRPLLVEYAALEHERAERLVVANDHWLAAVPYWAVWPFETLLVPRRHVPRLPDLSAAEREALAEILRRLLIRYDNLFATSFPYSMGWHGAPFGDEDVAHWQLHAHFYPPLLRSATVKKHMVGYEMLAEPLRDLTAEAAARRLREADE